MTTDQVGSVLLARNTDRLGRVDVAALTQDIKRVSSDVQAQRDVAAAAAKQIGNRDTRGQFVDALKSAGVARQPGFFERQWQGVKGVATGIYDGGASLVSGAYDLGKLGVEGAAATARFGYNYTTDSVYRAQTNDTVAKAATVAVDSAAAGLQATGSYAVDRIAHPEKLNADARSLASVVQNGVDAVGAKADAVYDGFDKARQEAVIQGTTDEFAGKIVGRVGFEVAAIVVPAGIAAKAVKGAELAVDATRVVEGTAAVVDATKATSVTAKAVEASKAAAPAETLLDSAKSAKAAQAATGARETETALTKGADRALAHTGDDASRVARAEAQAQAAAKEAAEAAKQAQTLTQKISQLTGIPEAKINEVINLPKGQRPDPATYMSKAQLAEHASAFENGGARFTLQSSLDKYGLAQKDGTSFIMTRVEADKMMASAGGDLRKIEQALGLPAGQLDSSSLVRIDFAPKALGEMNVRIPSGNEAGANAFWRPGGVLPSGAREAVIDAGNIVPSQFTKTVIK